jgi:2-hydroxychromene-2-carboxylate isomerase
MATLEFFFDCSSPWTYLAFHNVQPIANEFGIAIEWKPILVGGVLNAANPSVYESRKVSVPAKDAYLAKDLADWAKVAGLRILWKPSVFPVSSVKAMRGCLVAQRHGKLVEFASQIFASYWVDDRDISQDSVIAEVCEKVGLDSGTLLDGVAKPEIKDQLRRNTEELIARGGFGAPTVFVDRDDMYFGNDRLVLVRRSLANRLTN